MIPQTEGSRRTFLTAATAAGFTLAVRPLAAETIITPDEGLETAMVEVKGTLGTVQAYRAKPKGVEKPPVIVVIHEIFAVHEHIKDICRRLAKLGYYAIAPDLFARFGDATKVTDFKILINDFAAKVTDDQAMADVDAAVSFAKADGGDTARLGITGFCWGGRITWLYAEHNPALKAAVAWYGKVAGDATPNQPKSVIELAKDLKAPVLGLYGAADTGIPVSTLDELKNVATLAGKTVEFVVYPDTPHAFFADYRQSYTEAAAKNGWNRMKDWFKSNGV